MSNVLLLVQSACTEGFMDLSLLKRKAADQHSSLAEDNEATRWIITDANNRFTCDNVRMTGFLIGADIRTVTMHSSIRNEYPSIEVWYKSSEGSQYERNHSIMIELSSDNFTTNGIYHYVLSEPIYASSGYMLGVYQPEDSKSVVRFYKASANRNTTVGKIIDSEVNKMQSLINGSEIVQSNMTDIVMIHPITSQFVLSLS